LNPLPVVDAGSFTAVCDQANAPLSGSVAGMGGPSDPAKTDNNTGTNTFSNSSRGFKFTPSTNITLTDIGMRVPNFTGNFTWEIYEFSSQSLLHSQAFASNGTGGVSHYETLTSTLP
jgi:hypothetical protein